MNKSFTYEFEENKSKLETIEWDNLWRVHADRADKERVLIIGDSISCGYRDFVNEFLKERIYADGLGTSKAIDNSNLYGLIDYTLYQQPNYRVIQFNNGLHGWHLSSNEYSKFYFEIINYIMKKYPEKKLVIALTTPVRERNNIHNFGERNEQVILRNKAAVDIAHEFGLPINDLYELIKDGNELYLDDGVHLNDEGYRIIAGKCSELFMSMINGDY